MKFPADIKHKTNTCDIYNGSPWLFLDSLITRSQFVI